MTSNRTALQFLFLIIVMVLTAGQCLAQTAVPVLPNPGSTLLSRDQQRQLGFQAAAEIYKQMPVLPDNSVETQYVRRLGQRLAATIPPESSWPFEFQVVPKTGKLSPRNSRNNSSPSPCVRGWSGKESAMAL